MALRIVTYVFSTRIIYRLKTDIPATPSFTPKPTTTFQVATLHDKRTCQNRQYQGIEWSEIEIGNQRSEPCLLNPESK